VSDITRDVALVEAAGMIPNEERWGLEVRTGIEPVKASVAV